MEKNNKNERLRETIDKIGGVLWIIAMVSLIASYIQLHQIGKELKDIKKELITIRK